MRSLPHTSPRLLRTLATLVAPILVALVALSLAGPATAATDGTECGKKVLADWFDNGRIDRIYPLNCYEEAIDAIPDVFAARVFTLSDDPVQIARLIGRDMRRHRRYIDHLQEFNGQFQCGGQDARKGQNLFRGL